MGYPMLYPISLPSAPFHEKENEDALFRYPLLPFLCFQGCFHPEDSHLYSLRVALLLSRPFFQLSTESKLLPLSATSTPKLVPTRGAIEQKSASLLIADESSPERRRSRYQINVRGTGCNGNQRQCWPSGRHGDY